MVEVAVKAGDKVSTGSLILRMESSGAPPPHPRQAKTARCRRQGAQSARRSLPLPGAAQYQGAVDVEADLVVLGAGPGGYTAAFRAADLGMKVTLIERWPTLGGVCLNVGCIPSKALLHAAKVIEEAESMAAVRRGVRQADASTPARLRDWKNKVVARLTGGLDQLAKQRKVQVVRGTGRFLSANHLRGRRRRPAADRLVPPVHHRRRLRVRAHSRACPMTRASSTRRRRSSSSCRKRMLVIGGGIIGLEMATVYDALGVRVSVVELLDQLMPGVDADLLRPLERRIRKRYEAIMTGTKVSGLKATAAGIEATLREGGHDRDQDLRQGAGGRRPRAERPRASTPTRPA